MAHPTYLQSLTTGAGDQGSGRQETVRVCSESSDYVIVGQRGAFLRQAVVATACQTHVRSGAGFAGATRFLGGGSEGDATPTEFFKLWYSLDNAFDVQDKMR